MRMLVLVAMLAAGCKDKPPRQCIYQDKAYSVGATRCAPGRHPSGYTVHECRDTHPSPEWRDSEVPCTPMPDGRASGSGSGS